MVKASLDGWEPSWYDTQDNTTHFTTNFGQVVVDTNTWELVDCCIGIAQGYKQDRMMVKIYDGELQVLREQGMVGYSDALESSGLTYPIRQTYHGRHFGNLTVAEVLRAIMSDTNVSTAAIAAKKGLVKLMWEKLKFGREDLKLLRELLACWRKPVLKKDLVERKPIIVRTPIITQEVKKDVV